MAPPRILKIEGRQIIDSRGNPTVEADVTTYKGMVRRFEHDTAHVASP